MFVKLINCIYFTTYLPDELMALVVQELNLAMDCLSVGQAIQSSSHRSCWKGQHIMGGREKNISRRVKGSVETRKIGCTRNTMCSGKQ